MKTYPALKVQQPFGDLFIISIKAKDLLEITFSDIMRYDEDKNLVGSQRKLDVDKRVKDITDYINTDELAFPNSIIVACNYNEEGFIETDDSLRWSFSQNESCGIWEVTVPTMKKLAAIIDGQHRLNGFANASTERKEETDLVVSIYFDLPSPYQAYIFAKINANQKPVDRSLALEQFGYMANILPVEKWNPELLSVFLSRKLNVDINSNFYNHIKVAPLNFENYLEIHPQDQDWLVSTATVVDGFIRLIATNPRRDNHLLTRDDGKLRTRTDLVDDSSPLRKFYKDSNDIFIYKCVLNFFNAAEKVLFVTSNRSYIKKTVGIQALFGVLRYILIANLEKDKKISEEYFGNILKKASNINFEDNFFTASGIGKSRIQNAILIAIGIKCIEGAKVDDQPYYTSLLKNLHT